jgi:hypothetical protein
MVSPGIGKSLQLSGKRTLVNTDRDADSVALDVIVPRKNGKKEISIKFSIIFNMFE